MKFVEVTSLNSDTYDKYLNQIDDYGFYHSRNILDYLIKSSSAMNLSFFCFEQGKVVGFAPLCISKNKNGDQYYSSVDSGCHIPIVQESLPSRTRRKYYKEIFKQIYKKIIEHNIKYIDFFYHPIKFNSKKSAHIDYKDSFLINNFYETDTVTINLNLFDLKVDDSNFENKLYSKLRTEFRKKKYSELSFKPVNKKNSNAEEINKYFRIYEKLHFEAAGRRTRPESSFSSMLENLLQGKASLFTLKFNGIVFSVLFCFEYENYVIDASQANTVEEKYLKYFKLRHFLEQKTIEYYRREEFHYYEVGKTYFFDKDFKIFQEKHKRIGISKLRFGSDLLPVHYFRFNKNKKNIFNNKHKFIVENEF